MCKEGIRCERMDNYVIQLCPKKPTTTDAGKATFDCLL